MAYPNDAVVGTGHISDHNLIRDDIRRLKGKTISGRNYGNGVYLDDPEFTGGTDDLKLASAMSYAGAQTYKPHIMLGTRDHTFSTPLGQAYDGFGLIGQGCGWLNAEHAGLYQTRVNLTIGANNFLDVTSGTSDNWYLEGFDIRGNSTSTLVGGSGVLWDSTFRNLTVQGLKGVFGNGSNKLLVNLITIDGIWEILNCYDTYVNIGGSDCRGIFADGGNFGCGTISPPSTAAYQMIFAGLSKSYIGPVYITADNGWRGTKVTGSMSSGYGLTFLGGGIMEGRNSTTRCDGSVLRIEGGAVTVRDLNVNCGMFNPIAAEHGLIEVTGTDTQVVLDGINCGGHSSGVAANTPVVYASGTAGQVRVRCQNFTRGQRAGTTSWGSQLPVITQSNTGLFLDSDTSVVLV